MSRVQVFSIVVMALLFGGVFELVRQRRLMERYALLWMLSSATLLVLALWRDALALFADAIGIFYAPSALFAVALGFILMLLLHFSLVISRLTDQTKVLAQTVALLEERVGEERADPSERRSAGDADSVSTR